MKKLILMAVVGLGALATEAGLSDQYFYWSVSDAETAFSYAKLAYALTDGGLKDYLTISDTGARAVAPAGDGDTGTTTESVFSRLDSSYLAESKSWSDYAFAVEIYNSTGTLIGLSETFAYGDILANLYEYGGLQYIGEDGVTPKGISVGMIPEPTSGILLLLGLAGLALRRKRALLGVMVAAAGLGFGAANDALVSFSTKGPDTYKDGSTVLDGECYALVWTPSGAVFSGFNANGSLVSADDRIVVVASLAEGGKCPPTLFEIDAKDAEAYAGGSFGLYLLDTRVRGADGRAIVGGAGVLAEGAVGVAVNAAGKAAAGSDALTGGSVALASVGVYSKIDEPKVTAMDVKGAEIELKVAGMNGEVADYVVVHGAKPGEVSRPLETKVDGETLKVVKPEEGGLFLKVIGVRKFE